MDWRHGIFVVPPNEMGRWSPELSWISLAASYVLELEFSLDSDSLICRQDIFSQRLS